MAQICWRPNWPPYWLQTLERDVLTCVQQEVELRWETNRGRCRENLSGRAIFLFRRRKDSDEQAAQLNLKAFFKCWLHTRNEQHCRQSSLPFRWSDRVRADTSCIKRLPSQRSTYGKTARFLPSLLGPWRVDRIEPAGFGTSFQAMLSETDYVWAELDHDTFYAGNPHQLDHALLVFVLARWVGGIVQADLVDSDADEEVDHGGEQLNGYPASHLQVVRF